MRTSAVRFSAAVGVTAALATAGLGTSVLLHSSRSALSTSAPSSPQFPLSGAEITGLLSRPPDFGPLGDARRRSSCLSGLGYPASDAVLGARQVDIDGAPAVVLLLPGDAADTVAALAVRPNCSSADTGLLADTQIHRP
ncbi:MAG: hypothetical protein JO280_08895 [Mycobacteriaceae bacterium]|nr:hypothetical protein [Mycobacteriaceae bacterium]